ncbi:hypothetical protein SARC_07102 [Sphaeroforma arctica JP610]|uniref:Charged multivesicular body protein 2b n=1 Tax=Sphaeroforma arctica JP610 TaxID=667725 RepID=A0A0L0FUK1_9EUKA|nr:hypothetical protein SARC_07102 [Sphaeroforma arctica JP610]KNC80530.1 hypothetical protein SARC_07102 [Sphaeroforma arctica JP610]|eukprot:XP_014154432.1 hypothetical protein SARC_07102 [Sphaeroforma arctica JP610]
MFRKKKTPEELLREQKRELNRSSRQMERDRAKLEQQEKQLEGSIKRAAQKGDKVQATALAKQLVMVRKQREKSYAASAKLNDISAQATSMQANVAMTKAMAGTTKTMAATNKQMNPQKVQKTMMDFEKQSQMMEMNGEMMNDTIEGVMEADEDDAEDILNQVLDEIGVEVASSLPSAAMNKPAADAETEDDLVNRLAGLRAD